MFPCFMCSYAIFSIQSSVHTMFRLDLRLQSSVDQSSFCFYSTPPTHRRSLIVNIQCDDELLLSLLFFYCSYTNNTCLCSVIHVKDAGRILLDRFCYRQAWVVQVLAHCRSTKRYILERYLSSYPGRTCGRKRFSSQLNN